MRLIDADAFINKIREQNCKECVRRKGIKNGKMRYLYEVGGVPCRACETEDVLNEVDDAPTITPEPHEIGYYDCSNALLKMWMDNVLTDREYYRIADKLNEKWGKTELPEPFKGVTE